MLFDRAKMTVSGTPGTGAITVGSAVAGFQTFAAAGVPAGGNVSYAIEDAGNTWEIGRGTYTSGVLTRSKVIASSSSGSAISATSAAIVYLTALTGDLSTTEALFIHPNAAEFTEQNGSGSGVIVNYEKGVRFAEQLGYASGELVGAEQAIASVGATGWIVTARLKPEFPLNVNYTNAGIYIRNGAGHIAYFTFNQSNTGVLIETWSAFGTYNGTTLNSSINQPIEVWLRIQYDGTNINYQYSMDGYDFFTIYSEGYSASYAYTVTNCGVAMSLGDNGYSSAFPSLIPNTLIGTKILHWQNVGY